MNSTSLLNIKNNPECLFMEEEYIDEIKKIINIGFIKKKKTNKNINITKKPNFNLKKNKIDNKLIFILNKLGENNLDQLMIEFIQNININKIDDYNIVILKFFNKILEDNSFIPKYTLFLINVIKIIYAKNNYEPTYLINIIDNYITNTYTNFNEDNENKRINFINFIIELIKNNFYKNEFIDYFSNILLSQNKYIIDIKKWFSCYNKNKYIKRIKSLDVQDLRNRLLLESLFDVNKTINIKKTPNVKKNIQTDYFDNECDNIIEEYMHLKMNEEIIFFLKNNCNEEYKRQKFIEKLNKKYKETHDIELNNLLKTNKLLTI